jgi:hypothetical protein
VKAGLLSLGSRAVHCRRATLSYRSIAREEQWPATMRAATLSLAGLCGLAAAQKIPDPGPGECMDVLDNPFNPSFYQITKCCIAGRKDAPMVW